jgi:hypothetical protein
LWPNAAPGNSAIVTRQIPRIPRQLNSRRSDSVNHASALRCLRNRGGDRVGRTPACVMQLCACAVPQSPATMHSLGALRALCMNPITGSPWDPSEQDRRASPRVEYRRTPPARLDVAGQACAVRDLNPNGLRIEPAPPRRVWSPGQEVSGMLYLRTSRPMSVSGRILRVGATGLVIVPDGTGAWPAAAAIETERNDLDTALRRARSGT